VSDPRRVNAFAFSVFWILAVVLVTGFVSMGDCADPIETCLAEKRSAALPFFVIGLLVLVLGNWLLLRRRKN